MTHIHLGINVDHVATVRQARKTNEPDPVFAAHLAELGGADGITVHLRQDRRHIQDRDVRILKETVQTSLNLELAVGEDVLAIALEIKPHQACLVPEHRQEVTTEGGLNLARHDPALIPCIKALQNVGTIVSLFIEPDPDTIKRARDLGADAVEIHTGSWANAWAQAKGRSNRDALTTQLKRLESAADTAAQIGMRLHAGHGITYHNVGDILHLPYLRELNIGHTIVSRAMMVGMERAVRDMRMLIDESSSRS